MQKYVMRSRTWFSALALLCALGAFTRETWAATEGACPLTLKASLAANIRNDRLLIPADLDGHRASLAVDTGAPFGIITPHLVEELKLREEPLFEHTFVYG